MKLPVLLHQRNVPCGAALQQCDFPRYLSFTERRFAFMIGPDHFQPEFQPVTETVSERTRLGVFAFLVFAFVFFRFRRGNSF
ncbi:hypothetical protein [Streptomyces sp. IBSBF 3010]|uniref:hypothetical protein n=1 Tax=Streptomyces sp. IBSBF 3010 TaxID=2903526 RepID=UPI002FDB98D0